MVPGIAPVLGKAQDMILFAVLLGLPGPARSIPPGSYAERTREAATLDCGWSIDAILDGLRATETGKCKQGGRDALGDHGRALGPYQIHRSYFADARLPGGYAECGNPEFSRRVVLAYWKRWCPEALERCDAEVLVRIHNGGPGGLRKSSTIAFWHKVEQQLIADSARFWREKG
jgi:hypothetical protein